MKTLTPSARKLRAEQQVATARADLPAMIRVFKSNPNSLLLDRSTLEKVLVHILKEERQ